MSIGHYIVKCSKCGDVIQQCRCADPDKTVTYELCYDCRVKEREADNGQ